MPLTQYGHILHTKSKAVSLRHAESNEERKYSSYSFLTSALDGGEKSASRPGYFLPRGKDHCIRGRVGPRVGLDTEDSRKTPCLCRGSNPDHSLCSQTLYWLSYLRTRWVISDVSFRMAIVCVNICLTRKTEFSSIHLFSKHHIVLH
jgi:hypothetical protein